MRWPGTIEAGRVINGICSLQDFVPTFAAAGGELDLVAKVKKDRRSPSVFVVAVRDVR